MKNILSVLLLLTVSSFSIAQDLELDLAVSIRPTNTSSYEMNYLYSKEDQNGNIITIGTFRGTVDMDPGAGVVNIISYTNNSSDFFVQKLAPNGDYLWSAGFGTGDFDYAQDLIIDNSGNIIITGYAYGNYTQDFQIGTAVLDIDLVGGHDVFVLKIDPNGNPLWVKSVGSAGGEEGYRLAVAQNNNIVVAGIFNGTLDVDPGAGIQTISSSGYSTFLLELTEDGDYVRNTVLSGSAPNFVTDISLSANDELTVVGSFNGTLDLDPTAGVANFPSAGGRDIYATHLDQNWDYVWGHTVGGTQDDFAYAVGQDDDQNTYVGGSFFGTVQFETGVPVTSVNGESAYVIKLDNAGNFSDVSVFNGTGGEVIYAIDVDDHQNVLVGLMYDATVDVDPGLSNVDVTSAGGSSYDMCLLKLNATGDLIWYNPMGNTSSDYLLSVESISNNGVLISGHTDGENLDVDPNGTFIIDASYVPTAFTVRYLDASACSNVALVADSLSDVSCQGDGYVSVELLNAAYPVNYTWTPSLLGTDSIASISSPGIYTLTATDTTGCARSFSIIISGPEYATDFDLNANLVGTSFRTGFPATIALDGFNDGCSPISGDLKITLDPLVTFDGASIAPTQVIGNEIYWSFSNMAYDSVHIMPQLFLTVSQSAQIGDTVCFQVEITPVAGDINQGNNGKNYCFPIINGYDPNDISLNPMGQCDENYLLKDAVQTYTIRFQNTGNAEAVNIVVVDSLSQDLDINSFKLVGKSFDNLYVEVVNSTVLKFHMDSIMLADSTSNEPESHGYIIYEISPLSGVAENTEIQNTAEIYFDFNPAVVTNTTTAVLVSTIPCTLGFDNLSEETISVYPNPFENEFTIRVSDKLVGEKYVIVDQLGRVVDSGILYSTSVNLNLKELSSGLYLLKMNNSDLKIVKE